VASIKIALLQSSESDPSSGAIDRQGVKGAVGVSFSPELGSTMTQRIREAQSIVEIMRNILVCDMAQPPVLNQLWSFKE
jgi:hypothetical protein